ncbi:hypothetical protein [Bifidobacterium sp. ESL0732]|uniref:hypothetical protein n=1 Tax=Bifidobacterium sp. ESL0732 TaxID=2983222 RepID=UPI0023F8D88B|nr:hypothetical protein [Bifidobacterium sp. ESL0732]WEV63931.1 hypothetical protein OZX70_08415 [Bifidobacterium sp. ESL0732]
MAKHKMKARSSLIRRNIAVVVAAATMLLSGMAGANGLNTSTDTDFDVDIQAATGVTPQSKGTGSSDDPIVIDLVDPLSIGTQHWNVTVKSLGNDVGSLQMKFLDPDPNMKIKYKQLPTSASNGSTAAMNYSYYPDLFTQLRFSVFDGSQQLWTGRLGTEGDLNLGDPAANNAKAPGWLSARIPVSLHAGESKTYQVNLYVDSPMSKDQLAAYNGTTTRLGLIVKGETR